MLPLIGHSTGPTETPGNRGNLFPQRFRFRGGNKRPPQQAPEPFLQTASRGEDILPVKDYVLQGRREDRRLCLPHLPRQGRGDLQGQQTAPLVRGQERELLLLQLGGSLRGDEGPRRRRRVGRRRILSGFRISGFP
jgi:hypothetical protein